ncbi:cysteine--tRNA ligase [Patescibacteria group bacterium]|nr:cysteine--tRNA ligase [Patescibacteria group bacterium]
MKLYNSLTKEKEGFRSRQPGVVKMYHCGPTVYDYVHIGNLRSFLLGDIVRRSFEFLGYEVKQVMNITDVGHLVSDGDDGDDKMTKGLKREGKDITIDNMLALATTYVDAFTQDLTDMNIRTPHHLPRASEHIQEDIDMITTLEQKGFTYTTSDGVYFDTAQMADYGKLGGLNLDNDSEGRITENTEKRQLADFALWKFDAKLGWESPWGQGFPGWHIECSGMATKYLGSQFDIHTGGADLRSVHHNNEIAQSECATGCSPFVTYWLHGEMLNVQGEKLSKSTGGNITLNTLREKGFSPLAYRYLALQTHYRSPMNFSWEVLQAADNGLHNIYRDIMRLREHATTTHGCVSGNYREDFAAKIEDNFNLPQALAIFHDMLKSDLSDADKLITAYELDTVLGLGLEDYEGKEVLVNQELQELLDKRKAARDAKDFAESDRLRDAIADMGYTISDVDGEQHLEKK